MAWQFAQCGTTDVVNAGRRAGDGSVARAGELTLIGSGLILNLTLRAAKRAV